MVIGAVGRCVCAVSYTHLDVYKRQVLLLLSSLSHCFKDCFQVRRKLVVKDQTNGTSALFKSLGCDLSYVGEIDVKNKSLTFNHMYGSIRTLSGKRKVDRGPLLEFYKVLAVLLYDA